MASNLRELVEDLKLKFASSKYRNDPGILKQRVKEQGKDFYQWLQTFQNLFVVSSSETRDDILFYVKYDSKNVRQDMSEHRYYTMKKEVIEVQRKDAKSLPDHSHQSVLWDQTFYLNLLLHEFEYQLTCCVLKQKKGTEHISERIKTQITMQVYPSTKEIRMDKKSKTTEDSYPNLMFYIDNYEQIFKQILLHHPGEKVVVQIVAINSALSIRRLIFMGGLDFTVLKNAVMQKEKENASFTVSLLSRKKNYTEFQNDFFFIQMKGPDEKGYAQMAVQLTNSNDNFDESYTEPLTTNGENPLPPNLAGDSSRSLESSISSSDTVDTKIDDHSITSSNSGSNTVTSNNYLAPQSDTLGTSPGGESITSTHSSDLLCPSKDKEECTATTKDTFTEEQDGGMLKKNKKSSKRRSLKKNSDEQQNYTVNAFLTYIQLPWYTITEDILQGSREPLF